MNYFTYCCRNCFVNDSLQEYIDKEYIIEGDCPCCKSKNVQLITTRKLGEYMRECLDKAYDYYDNGTGAYYDPDERDYCGPKGELAKKYSVREILEVVEGVFDEAVENSGLLESLFTNLYSIREIQKGAEDPYADFDEENWVIKNDLYGKEQTCLYQTWEEFKFVILHCNRFFNTEWLSRESYLENMKPYLYDFIEDIQEGAVFYRARRENDSITDIDNIDAYDKLGPPPAKGATTNRMNPAGIPYFYLSGDVETTIKECRIKKGEKAIVAEFVSTRNLQILDLSKPRRYGVGSIFSPDYDHDDQWIDSFLKGYVNEISKPVDEDRKSYEYAATQVVAEFFRNQSWCDGISFKSSVGIGKNYVFFCGPDPNHTTAAYPYPYGDIAFSHSLPILPIYTESFSIKKVIKVESETMKTIKERLL